jgi:crotonobetainyl-CoA:carnitine CoA-transferase CaiB-like acyl-CoA transferase
MKGGHRALGRTERTSNAKNIGKNTYQKIFHPPDHSSLLNRFATDSKRCETEEEIVGAIADWVSHHTMAEVMAALDAARVPAGPILSTGDIMSEPQYQERGMFEKAAPPGGGEEVTVPAMAPMMGGTPGVTRWAGPELGQHTDEVLGDLGLGEEEIAKLREVGAI